MASRSWPGTWAGAAEAARLYSPHAGGRQERLHQERPPPPSLGLSACAARTQQHPGLVSARVRGAGPQASRARAWDLGNTGWGSGRVQMGLRLLVWQREGRTRGRGRRVYGNVLGGARAARAWLGGCTRGRRRRAGVRVERHGVGTRGAHGQQGWRGAGPGWGNTWCGARVLRVGDTDPPLRETSSHSQGLGLRRCRPGRQESRSSGTGSAGVWFSGPWSPASFHLRGYMAPFQISVLSGLKW